MSPRATLVEERPMIGVCVAPAPSVTSVLQASPADVPGQRIETAWEEHAYRLETLLSQSRYKEAVLLGSKTGPEYSAVAKTEGARHDLARAESAVHYAEALCHAGAMEEAIAVLNAVIAEMENGWGSEYMAWQRIPCTVEGRQRNRILGLAHSHLGYANWTNLGHDRLALQEFHTALCCFDASSWREEYANTCDNIGRVYAQLQQHGLAQHFIREGLEIRRELGDEYRIALSLNSLANAHLLSGALRKADQASAEALQICERLGAIRGIGLACLTRGQLLRRIVSGYSVYPYERCAASLDEATRHLERAVGIFKQSVYEPVRLIAAYNELGCTYRDLADLARDWGLNPGRIQHYCEMAVKCLAKAAGLASRANTVAYVDSCEDLAQMYFQNHQYDMTEHWLELAEDAIPKVYGIREGTGCRGIPVEECVEGLWWQLGKIHRLRSHIIFQRGLDDGSGQVSPEAMAQATRHHSLSVAYSSYYSRLAASGTEQPSPLTETEMQTLQTV